MTPPTDISANALFQQLCTMPRPFRHADFPRKDKDGVALGIVAIRVLTQAEQTEVAAEAERFVRKIFGKDLPAASELHAGYDAAYSNAAAVEVLWRAVRNPDDLTAPFFPKPDSIRDLLTADETALLMLEYYSVQRELGPISSQMSEADVDAWIARIEEGGRGDPFASLSPDALSALVTSLVRRIRSFSTATPLSGSQPDATPNETGRSDA